MEQLIIGTAGHVDHGKTVLIKALTGVDTDRLEEEKKRGISIDLGFAPFKLPGGRLAGIVDVPGHEKFIHNMLAGAAGLDLVLLVVDATEGVMPQTKEHLDILQLLGINCGIVVVTKIDLVDEEWQDLVVEDLRGELEGTFLENAPVHPVSAVEGRGIEELKALIDQMTAAIEPRSSSGPLRLPIDRSFIISGFGTVVTGTLIQGTVKVGETVEIVPPGIEARVRNIQVHASDVEKAVAGTRVALNLSGLEKSQVLRGSVVSNPGYYSQTGLLDLSVELLPHASRKIKNLDPVHFFLGTARSVARLVLLDKEELLPGEQGLVQCRLDHLLVAERGDPFVIRSYSPMTTIGGGMVLDPYPKRHRRFRTPVIDNLNQLRKAPSEGGDRAFLKSKLNEIIIADSKKLAKETRLAVDKVDAIMEEMIKNGEVTRLGKSYINNNNLEHWEKHLIEQLQKYHKTVPLRRGISRARLHGFLPSAFGQKEYDSLLDKLQKNEYIKIIEDLISLSEFEPQPSKEEEKYISTLLDQYRSAGLQPPGIKDVFEKSGVPIIRKEELYYYMVNNNLLIKISEDLYLEKKAYVKALDLLKNHFAQHNTITLAQFRDLSGTSRKYAQTILEHFDRERYTRRVEDHRVPLKLIQQEERR